MYRLMQERSNQPLSLTSHWYCGPAKPQCNPSPKQSESSSNWWKHTPLHYLLNSCPSFSTYFSIPNTIKVFLFWPVSKVPESCPCLCGWDQYKLRRDKDMKFRHQTTARHLMKHGRRGLPVSQQRVKTTGGQDSRT